MPDQEQPQAPPAPNAGQVQAAVDAQQQQGGSRNKFVDQGLEFMGLENRKTGEPVRAHEGQYQKMRAAQTGGAGPGLAPDEAEQALQRQRAVLQQRAAAQGQQQAQQAQQAFAQTPTQPPPAPVGQQGVTQPFPAEAGQEEEK